MALNSGAVCMRATPHIVAACGAVLQFDAVFLVQAFNEGDLIRLSLVNSLPMHLRADTKAGHIVPR